MISYSHFNRVIADWRNRPFKRGSSDCCAFVDYVIHAMTGQHYLPEYHDDDTAFAILNSFRGGLEGAVSHYMKREPHDNPGPTDVVLIVIEHGGKWWRSLGVMLDEKRVATVFEDGLLRDVSSKWVTKGWSWE